MKIKAEISTNDIIIMSESIAYFMPEVKMKAVWKIESKICKVIKNKISQSDRLKLASKIIRTCINKNMSESEDYAEIISCIKDIFKNINK